MYGYLLYTGLFIVREPSLIDLAHSGGIIGIDNGSSGNPTAIEIRIVEQVRVEEDHLPGPERDRYNFVTVNAGGIYLEPAARFKGIDGSSHMAAGNDLETAIYFVSVFEVDKAGDKFVGVGAPAAGPILMPGVRGATGKFEIQFILEQLYRFTKNGADRLDNSFMISQLGKNRA